MVEKIPKDIDSAKNVGITTKTKYGDTRFCGDDKKMISTGNDNEIRKVLVVENEKYYEMHKNNSELELKHGTLPKHTIRSNPENEWSVCDAHWCYGFKKLEKLGSCPDGFKES